MKLCWTTSWHLWMSAKKDKFIVVSVTPDSACQLHIACRASASVAPGRSIEIVSMTTFSRRMSRRFECAGHLAIASRSFIWRILLLLNEDTTSAISSFIWHTSAAFFEDKRMSHASFPISVRRRSVGGFVFVKTIHLGYDRCLVQRAVEYIIVKKANRVFCEKHCKILCSFNDSFRTPRGPWDWQTGCL